MLVAVYILSFIPRHNVGQPNAVHASKEGQGSKNYRGNNEFPLVENIDKGFLLLRMILVRSTMLLQKGPPETITNEPWKRP
jgi:hypothetical protein